MKHIIISLIVVLLFSCHSHTDNNSHKHNSHTHDTHTAKNTSNEVPRLNYTVWTSKTELFVDFPALIVGEKSQFATHLTIMDKHQAISKGKVTINLTVNGKNIQKIVETPDSPGIFLPVLQPVTSGTGRLKFVVETANYKDTIVVKNVKVYDNIEEVQKNVKTNQDDKENITFLKEQAWKMPFQTVKAKENVVFQTISTFGIWQTAPSSTYNVIANANGKVRFIKEDIFAGKIVKQGETLITISGKGITGNISKDNLEISKINLQQAKSEYERKKSLYEDKIIPLAKFEEIKQKYLNARVTYKSLSKGYSPSGYSSKPAKVKAPFSGYLSNISVSNGSFVNEGTNLFIISKPQSKVLKIQVSPKYAQQLYNIDNVWYKTANNQWLDMKKAKGAILSVDKIVSAKKPNLSVFAQINDTIEVAQGAFSEVIIGIGTGKRSVVIPKSALMEDYGNYSVIVQLSGESFEQRSVVIGSQNGNEVEIIKGLKENEIVVTKGAYQVKMQTMSGQAPAHGHAH